MAFGIIIDFYSFSYIIKYRSVKYVLNKLFKIAFKIESKNSTGKTFELHTLCQSINFTASLFDGGAGQSTLI